MTLLLSGLAVLAAGAVLSLLLMRLPRAGLYAAMASVVMASVLSAMAAVGVLAGTGGGEIERYAWAMPIGNATLAMDGLSAWFVLTISLLSLAVAIYSIRYMAGEIGHESVALYGVFTCVLVAAMIVFVCAADLVLYLVAWEAMSLSAFFLVNFHNREERVRRGAWMYLVATHIGTALCLLPMFAILAWRADGALDFAGVAKGLGGADGRLCGLIFLLGLVGFGTKAGLMPMHVWLPNAHPVAPTPVSALLSGVVIKTGIYGILRLLTWTGPLPGWCGCVLLGMGMISGVMGVLYAIAQHDLKRLLAYHSVENIGIIALGIGIGMLGQTMQMPAIAAVGYAGALLHVMNHALFKGLLFLSAGSVIHSTGTGEIDRLGGLARRTPVNALLFLIAAISICGLPPFNGFVSEWLIYGSLFRGAGIMRGVGAPMAVLALTSLAVMGGLALACFAKVFSVVFLGAQRDASLEAHPTPVLMRVSMGFLAALCAAIGIVPVLAAKLAGRGAGALVSAPFDEAIGATLASTGWITLLALVFLAIVAGLLVLRGRSGVAGPAPRAVTWGCGFSAPSARMQYTASSFAWSLISSFRGVLWPQRHVEEPRGLFPATTHLATHTQDMAEKDLFTPVFRGVARVTRVLQTMRLSEDEQRQAGMPAPPTDRNVCPTKETDRNVCPTEDTDRNACPTKETDRNVCPTEETDRNVCPTERPIGLLVSRAISAIRRGTIHTCLAYIVITLVVLFVIEALWTPKSAVRVPTTRPVASVEAGVR